MRAVAFCTATANKNTLMNTRSLITILHRQQKLCYRMVEVYTFGYCRARETIVFNPQWPLYGVRHPSQKSGPTRLSSSSISNAERHLSSDEVDLGYIWVPYLQVSCLYQRLTCSTFKIEWHSWQGKSCQTTRMYIGSG